MSYAPSIVLDRVNEGTEFLKVHGKGCILGQPIGVVSTMRITDGSVDLALPVKMQHGAPYGFQQPFTVTGSTLGFIVAHRLDLHAHGFATLSPNYDVGGL